MRGATTTSRADSALSFIGHTSLVEITRGRRASGDSIVAANFAAPGSHTAQDTVSVPDMQTKYQFQLAGIGFGFLPEAWARADIARGALVEKQVEEGKPDETLYLAWRTGEAGAALAWWKQRLRASNPLSRMLGQPDLPPARPYRY